MAEFSSLNGYAVKDSVARSIAKGRNQAVAFTDYATMIEALNEYEKDEFKAGQNIYIGVVGVPDLWVYSVEDIRHTYIYESDEDVVEKLTTNTTIQVGFFKLAMLEGQKVDLTTYDQHLAKHDGDITELDGKITDGLNEVNSSLTAENSQTFQFAYDSESGKYGYKAKVEGADTFFPFKQYYQKVTKDGTANDAFNVTLDLSTLIPKYEDLVLWENCFIKIDKFSGGNANSPYELTYTYNNKTGVLKVTSTTTAWLNLRFTVYYSV